MTIDLISTGILLSLSGAIIFYLKDIPNKIVQYIKRQVVFTVTVYQYDELYDAIEEWLSINYNKNYRDVEAYVNANNYYPSPQLENNRFIPEVKYRHDGAEFLIKYGNSRIYISNGREKLERASSMRELYFRQYKIYGYNSKKLILSLIKEAHEQYTSRRKTTNTIIYINSQYGNWEKSNEIKVKTFDNVFIDPEIKERIKKDISEFQNNEDWYTERAIPYKRGYLLYGLPGNGKTTTSLAISHYVNRNVCSLSLRSLSGEESLRRAFSELPLNCVLLIEDIDACFEGRKSLVDKITFSALLNCLDGCMYKHGAIVIMTTNHIEKLDPALIRSGRCDLQIEIDNPNANLVAKYVETFYGIHPVMLVNHKNDISMSTVQNICIENKDDIMSALLKMGQPKTEKKIS